MVLGWLSAWVDKMLSELVDGMRNKGGYLPPFIDLVHVLSSCLLCYETSSATRHVCHNTRLRNEKDYWTDPVPWSTPPRSWRNATLLTLRTPGGTCTPGGVIVSPGWIPLSICGHSTLNQRHGDDWLFTQNDLQPDRITNSNQRAMIMDPCVKFGSIARSDSSSYLRPLNFKPAPWK